MHTAHACGCIYFIHILILQRQHRVKTNIKTIHIDSKWISMSEQDRYQYKWNEDKKKTKSRWKKLYTNIIYDGVECWDAKRYHKNQRSFLIEWCALHIYFSFDFLQNNTKNENTRFSLKHITCRSLLIHTHTLT